MKQIWAKDLRDELNISLIFTYKYTPSAGDKLSLASDVPFRVTVNGSFIGYGPRRMAHGHAAINHYPLDDFTENEAEIKIESVSYRADGFYIGNQVPFVAAEISSNGKIIANSLDFKVYRNTDRLQKVQRFAFQRGFTEAYKLGYSTLKEVDTDELTICTLHENDVPYPSLTPIIASPTGNGNVFISDEHPVYDDRALYRAGTQCFLPEEQEYRVTKVNDAVGFEKTGNGDTDILETSYIDFVLPRIASGFVAFDIEVSDDSDIMIVTDELPLPAVPERAHLLKNGATNINGNHYGKIALVNYKLKKGTYSLCTFEPDAVKNIRFYSVSGKAKLSNVRFITYENASVTSSFHCDDEELNLMYEAGVNTFIQNAVDIPTDCPSRERAGWLCDSYFTAKAEKHLTGKSLVEENFHRALLDRHSTPNIPDEVFPMCYPADTSLEKIYIHNWCMWQVLQVADYKKRGGKAEIIEEYRSHIFKFLDYTLKFLNKENLLENLNSWVFIEWSRANQLTRDVSFPTNMLFSTALKTASELYGEPKYAEIATKMDKAIYELGYNGKFFIDNAIRVDGKLTPNTSEWTETCQYYAFYLGYADKARNPELYHIMFDDINGKKNVRNIYPQMGQANSFIGLYLRLDYLSSLGEHEKVISDLKSYFLEQARTTGTYWENVTPGDSCCHGFASIICEWIAKAKG